MEKSTESKIDHIHTTNRPMSTTTPEPLTPTTSPEPNVTTEIQPPLPLDQPLLEESPNMSFTLKEEIEDVECNDSDEGASGTINPTNLTEEVKNKKSDDSTEPRTMCLDFTSEAAPSVQSVSNQPPPLSPLSFEMQTSVPDSALADQIGSEAYPDIGVRSQWPYFENAVSATRDLVHEDQQLQKRIEIIRNRLEKIKKARFEKRQALEMLSRKRERIMATLATLMNPSGGLTPLPSPSEERQKSVLDRLKSNISTNLVTEIEEDSRNSLNMSSLLAKLLTLRQI